MEQREVEEYNENGGEEVINKQTTDHQCMLPL